MTTDARVPGAVQKYRILVVDDHPIVRRGLALLITRETDLEICGGAETASSGLRQVQALRPDLVLVDISLRDSNGIELLSQIKTRYPDVKTLVWSMFDERAFAERALRAGAMGYINKQEPIEEVVVAVRRVLRGEVYLSREMTNLLIRRVGAGQSLNHDPVTSLTERELEVFQMIGEGMTTQQIARTLKLSVKTIESHREKIKAKLNVETAAALTRLAVQWVLEASGSL
jgi:DNA-binding NarL/FixJ family response regulator